MDFQTEKIFNKIFDGSFSRKKFRRIIIRRKSFKFFNKFSDKKFSIEISNGFSGKINFHQKNHISKIKF